MDADYLATQIASELLELGIDPDSLYLISTSEMGEQITEDLTITFNVTYNQENPA